MVARRLVVRPVVPLTSQWLGVEVRSLSMLCGVCCHGGFCALAVLTGTSAVQSLSRPGAWGSAFLPADPADPELGLLMGTEYALLLGQAFP